MAKESIVLLILSRRIGSTGVKESFGIAFPLVLCAVLNFSKLILLNKTHMFLASNKVSRILQNLLDYCETLDAVIGQVS